MWNRLSAVAFIAACAAFSPLAALAQQKSVDPQPWPEWYGPWHMWGYGFWWGPFFMMVGIPLVIAVALFFILRSGGVSSSGTGRRAALDILDQRFAQGEIEEAEYDSKRAKLLSRP